MGVGALALLALAAPAAAGPVDGGASFSELIEAQTRLVERARDYRASLEQVLTLQETEAARAAARARSRRDFFERGIVSRRELEDSERAWAAARNGIQETQARMAEADALMGETLASIELARLPRASQGKLVTTPAVIRYEGAVDLDASAVSTLERFFALRFRRALPVSARGQTTLHDRLGLDHRHAIDVAVHPDSEEGRALVEYLRLQRIPFLAFRRPIPGASTGAHVHIGQTSARLAPVRNTGR